MEILNSVLSRDRDFSELLSDIKNNRLPIAATGLSLNSKSAVLSAIYSLTKKKIAVITKDEAEALEIMNDAKAFGVNAINFPVRDYCIGNISGYGKEYEQKRTDTLSKLLDGAFELLTISVDAAAQLTVPPETLANSRFTISQGESFEIKDLIDKLLCAGYTKSELCEGQGQFSVRGGIFDVFPINAESPCRIEFWGDEVDSISYFDTETQRRTEATEKIEITPACEVLFNPSNLIESLDGYLKASKHLTEKQKERITSDIDALTHGITFPYDRYLPIIYPNGESVFDYLEDTILFVSESGSITERLKSMLIQQTEDITAYLEEGFLSEATSCLWLGAGELWDKLQKAVILENFPRGAYELPIKNIINFNYKRSTPWSGDINILLEDISYFLEQKGKVLILAGEEKAARVLTDELCEKGINAVFSENPDDTVASVTVALGGLSGGIEIPSQKFLLITHRFIAADTKKHRKRPKNAQEIGSLDELHIGDYVVHSAHGIGIFDGINRITNNGITKDYIKIKYAKSDVLYVPVTQLDLVSRYIGSANENGTLKLNRLGGSEWQKTRRRVKAAVKDMAKQLTALYAKRMSVKGYAFSPDTDLQNDFERRFEYEETDDQLRCINEIKRDMEREVPMDRLLCGDVGFGKTEVALRAAFKCISEGKQCALLVPTTILAMQHYNTITRRFGEMPITVKLLNRFVPPKQQEKIITDLKCGRLDMVVGTHRLISKDVSFKDIGLVIIDEEQRFGVAQKERLKELYPFVDILTLSATPIPRTLNMAMSGLRDMSSIDEAPGDRHPVQTYVLEYNQGVIIDAINKEIRRGGQVYYLHNRVESIERCASRLKQRLPDISVGIAHGKMSEDELTNVWRQLLEHKIDLLVCTTIIETGVDVPNANTLIIEDADRMGLAQLHQLRGRVGRSPRRAYAYFCFGQNRQLSDVASKRLEAIREYTEFGSGFKIAMRDLEIRGAGSILGGDQHGNMESVGYDMYLKLLSEAVNEENGIEPEDDIPCTIDLNISAHIPESYIESLPARLGIYKRIAAIRNDDDASDVIDELCDRFGEPPRSVMGLIDISILRNKAANAKIAEITGTSNTAILHINSIVPEVMSKLSAYFGNRFMLNATGKPVYTIRLKNGQKMSDLVTELGKAL
ncbi:MAG: transcription-repair coupling factor [Ruminococcaceae bacterium]|nr:transcription-repair coupling factor [Oscillospiraceae bacterium]